ncbi:MAG: hypothetical protein Q4C35_11295 [Eubacteriales bacterium]|nr:hypothetical protein [Eubacteriales bacterium]
MKWLQRAALALCLMLLPAWGLAASGMELEAEMGYDGNATYVRRLPVTVRLTNHGGDADGKVVVDVNRSETQFDRYELPVTVAAGSTVNVTVPVVLTQRQKAYNVKWVEDGQILAQQEVKPAAFLNPASLIVGVMGSDAQGFGYMNITKTSDALARNEYWATVPLTLESFPSDAEGLRFFDMLAVDGVDLTALSDAQKQALDKWLRDGGVVLVGGGAKAAAGFPFFSQYTGISAGELAHTPDPTGELLSLFGVTGEPLGQEVITVALKGASGQAVGAAPLADVSRVKNGFVITASFALSEKPLNVWLGKSVIWQRMLITYAQSRYKAIINARAQGSYSDSSFYVDTGITDAMGVPNGSEMLWPVAVIAVFVALVGFGSYALLKKLDKREWMWLSVPALAVAASLAIWLMSGALPLREPIGVHYTLAAVDEDGVTQSFTAVVAAKAQDEALTVGAREGTVDLANTISYYMPSDDNAQEAAAELRYTCTYGVQPSVTFPKAGVWAKQAFVMQDVPTQDVSGVSGECGWDGESLVATVTNGSQLALSEGIFLSEYGFASVPALLPGQSRTVKLTTLPQAKPAGQRAREDVVKDGALLAAQDRQNYSQYDFIQVFLGTDEKEKDAQIRTERNIRRGLMYAALNNVDFNLESRFFYMAFSDGLDALELMLDGQPVKRSAQYGGVRAELRYNPVASDGSLRFLRGAFPVSTAVLDSGARPSVGEALASNRYQSFPLSQSPAFAFDVSALPEGIALSAMDISPRYSYYDYKVSLYNAHTGEWDAFKLYTRDRNGQATTQTEALKLEDYLNGGYLYARFERYGATEDYADVDTPVLTMDGRMK